MTSLARALPILLVLCRQELRSSAHALQCCLMRALSMHLRALLQDESLSRAHVLDFAVIHFRSLPMETNHLPLENHTTVILVAIARAA